MMKLCYVVPSLMLLTGAFPAAAIAQFGGKILINGADVAIENKTKEDPRRSKAILLGARPEAEVATPERAPVSQSRLAQVRSLMAQAGYHTEYTPVRAKMRQAVTQRVAAPPSYAQPTYASGYGCRSHQYRPSNILKPESENRRRLLFPKVVEHACANGVPPALFDALIIQESRYNPMAVSPKGAVGLAQLMPGTAAQLNVRQWSIDDNLKGGAKLLGQHLKKYRQPSVALAAYNAGPGAVAKYGGNVPRYRETMGYVRNILRFWEQLNLPPIF